MAIPIDADQDEAELAGYFDNVSSCAHAYLWRVIQVKTMYTYGVSFRSKLCIHNFGQLSCFAVQLISWTVQLIELDSAGLSNLLSWTVKQLSCPKL